MIFTKVAWLAGWALLVFMCWLAIRGWTTIVPLLVTGFVLLVLIGGGNVLNARRSPYARGGRSSSSSHDSGEAP